VTLDELLQNKAECERLRLHFKTTVAGMGVPSRVSGLSAGSSDAEPVLSHPSRTRSGGTGATLPVGGQLPVRGVGWGWTGMASSSRFRDRSSLRTGP
jgi:hypothetical protein